MYIIKQFSMQINIFSYWKFQRKSCIFFKEDCSQDGYIYNSRLSLCWRPFSQKVNYTEALQTCLADRGRLLRVSSLPIWEYLKTELGESVKVQLYIKLTEKKKMLFLFTCIVKVIFMQQQT